MIGQVRGKLIYKQPPLLLIDVQGVGYELEAPMTTFYNLPEISKEICLFTHLVVRDDAHLLFGFATENERRLFRTLLKVNGHDRSQLLTHLLHQLEELHLNTTKLLPYVVLVVLQRDLFLQLLV